MIRKLFPKSFRLKQQMWLRFHRDNPSSKPDVKETTNSLKSLTVLPTLSKIVVTLFALIISRKKLRLQQS